MPPDGGDREWRCGGRGWVGAHLCVRWQCAAACARPGRAASPPPPGPPGVSSYSSSPSSGASGWGLNRKKREKNTTKWFAAPDWYIHSLHLTLLSWQCVYYWFVCAASPASRPPPDLYVGENCRRLWRHYGIGMFAVLSGVQRRATWSKAFMYRSQIIIIFKVYFHHKLQRVRLFFFSAETGSPQVLCTRQT